jgi:hypothetical protein
MNFYHGTFFTLDGAAFEVVGIEAGAGGVIRATARSNGTLATGRVMASSPVEVREGTAWLFAPEMLVDALPVASAARARFVAETAARLLLDDHAAESAVEVAAALLAELESKGWFLR